MKFDDAVTKILEKLNTYSEIWVSHEDLKKIKIGKYDIAKIINYLNHHKLITNKSEQGKREYMLNPYGIKYLLDSNQENEKKEFSLIVAVTGCIIALVGAQAFLKDFMSPKGLIWLNIISLILVIFCLVPVINFIYKRVLKGDAEDE